MEILNDVQNIEEENDIEVEEKYTIEVQNPNSNLSTLEMPAYLLNVPFSLSAVHPNNIWMTELEPNERKINKKKAMRQFSSFYNFLASESLVMILPTPIGCALQDLVYTANLGVVLEPINGRNIVILSNFKTNVRKGEELIGKYFFEQLGYEIYMPPFHFEGEAELKHLYDNIYIGGYGIRTDIRALKWVEERFSLNIIKVEEVDQYLYHLDCTIFPLTRTDTLVCTEMFSSSEIKSIERYTNVIDVSADDCFAGICNSLRVHNMILNASNILDLKISDEDYNGEKNKNRKLEDIASNFAFEVVFFNMSEFFKSGALLSCMVMHLNRRSYEFSLL
jgi:N-dimethylarginine dimethylaminohydrolase